MARTAASTSREFFRRDEIGLVEHDDVGKGDLVFGLAAVLQAQRQVLGIDKGDDRIELGLGAHVLVHEEGLRHRSGSARPVVSTTIASKRPGRRIRPFDDADQVAAHRAADAAIVHLVDLFVGFDDQFVVDADLAELVDDHGVALAVVLRQDTVEQGGLAGAEIAGEHGHGDLRLRFAHRMRPRCWLDGGLHIGRRLGFCTPIHHSGDPHAAGIVMQLKWSSGV